MYVPATTRRNRDGSTGPLPAVANSERALRRRRRHLTSSIPGPGGRQCRPRPPPVPTTRFSSTAAWAWGKPTLLPQEQCPDHLPRPHPIGRGLGQALSPSPHRGHHLSLDRHRVLPRCSHVRLVGYKRPGELDYIISNNPPQAQTLGHRGLPSRNRATGQDGRPSDIICARFWPSHRPGSRCHAGRHVARSPRNGERCPWGPTAPPRHTAIDNPVNGMSLFHQTGM
jgi:hypothetical protein